MWPWIDFIRLLYVQGAVATLVLARSEEGSGINLERVATVVKSFKDIDGKNAPSRETQETEAPSRVETSQPPLRNVHTKIYEEIKRSKGLKPELAPAGRPKQADRSRDLDEPVDKEKVLHHPSSHCECVKNWKDFDHICSLNFHFGLEVVVLNRTKNGYYVTLLDTYKMPQNNLNLVKGKTVHLRFPHSNSKINLKFARCRCVNMKHSKRYVAFGYKSDGGMGEEVLHVHHAVLTQGTQTEVYTRLTRVLQRILNHQCKEKSKEHAEPVSGLKELSPVKVGERVGKDNDDFSSHHHGGNTSEPYGQLKESSLPIKELGR